MRELEIHLEGRPCTMVIKVGEVYRFEEATAEEIQTLRISVVNHHGGDRQRCLLRLLFFRAYR